MGKLNLRKKTLNNIVLEIQLSYVAFSTLYGPNAVKYFESITSKVFVTVFIFHNWGNQKPERPNVSPCHTTRYRNTQLCPETALR